MYGQHDINKCIDIVCKKLYLENKRDVYWWAVSLTDITLCKILDVMIDEIRLVWYEDGSEVCAQMYWVFQPHSP